MPEISLYALETAIRAVDEKIGVLQAQVKQADSPRLALALNEELARNMVAAECLRESHEEAAWEGQAVTPYTELARFYHAVSVFDDVPTAEDEGDMGGERCPSVF